METLPFKTGHIIRTVTVPHTALAKGANLKIQHTIYPATTDTCTIESSYQIDWTSTNPMKQKIEKQMTDETISQLKVLYKYLKQPSPFA